MSSFLPVLLSLVGPKAFSSAEQLDDEEIKDVSVADIAAPGNDMTAEMTMELKTKSAILKPTSEESSSDEVDVDVGGESGDDQVASNPHS